MSIKKCFVNISPPSPYSTSQSDGGGQLKTIYRLGNNLIAVYFGKLEKDTTVLTGFDGSAKPAVMRFKLHASNFETHPWLAFVEDVGKVATDYTVSATDVMDQYTRKIVGFATHKGSLNGVLFSEDGH